MVFFSLRTLKAKVLPFNTERFLRPERNLVFQVDKSVPQRINLFEIECFPHFINGWHREFPAWKSGKVVSLRERVCPFDKYSLYHDKEDVVHCDEAVYELPGVNVYRIRWNGRKQTFSCRLDKQASHRGMRRRKVPVKVKSKFYFKICLKIRKMLVQVTLQWRCAPMWECWSQKQSQQPGKAVVLLKIYLNYFKFNLLIYF